jgi:hypothetical protein
VCGQEDNDVGALCAVPGTRSCAQTALGSGLELANFDNLAALNRFEGFYAGRKMGKHIWQAVRLDPKKQNCDFPARHVLLMSYVLIDVSHS